MGAILIDNASLVDVLRSNEPTCLFDDSSNELICFSDGSEGLKDPTVQNYLYALVLWDDIYALKSDNISRSVLEKQMGIDEALEKYYNVKSISYFVSDLKYEAIVQSEKYLIDGDEEYNGVVQSSFFYMLLGLELGYNTYLSKDRARFVKESGIFNHFERTDIINRLEKDVLDFYKEMNEKVGKNFISFKTPLLLDYITRNCDKLSEAIALAKEIRKEKDVIQFRKAMDKMEDSLNNGDFVAFNQYLSIIPDIVSGIKKAGYEETSTTIIVTVPPAISKDIKTYKLDKKMIHLNFLVDLAKFGMEHGRGYRNWAELL